jgi:hypothetical protein
VDVENGDADGQAADLGLIGDQRFSIDQGDICGGATHVKGDKLYFGSSLRDCFSHTAGANDAASRTREDAAHTVTTGFAQADGTSIGLHDAQGIHLTPNPSPLKWRREKKCLLQARKVAIEDGRDVGVDDGGAGAFELAELREDFAGGGN